MNKYHLFVSTKYPDRAITIGERPDGKYFIPSAIHSVPEDDNLFDSIEQIELTLDDSLTLIISKNQVN